MNTVRRIVNKDRDSNTQSIRYLFLTQSLSFIYINHYNMGGERSSYYTFIHNNYLYIGVYVNRSIKHGNITV